MAKATGTGPMPRLITWMTGNRHGSMPICIVKKAIFGTLITGIAKPGKSARTYRWKRNGSSWCCNFFDRLALHGCSHQRPLTPATQTPYPTALFNATIAFLNWSRATRNWMFTLPLATPALMMLISALASAVAAFASRPG